MMAQFVRLYGSGIIRYTQTSFLELVTAVEVHRIDFVGLISAAKQADPSLIIPSIRCCGVTGSSIPHFTWTPTQCRQTWRHCWQSCTRC